MTETLQELGIQKSAPTDVRDNGLIEAADESKRRATNDRLAGIGVVDPMLRSRARRGLFAFGLHGAGILALCVLLVGCGGKKPVVQPPPPKVEIVEVVVPQFVKAVPPAELLTPITPPLPVFISPFDPNATSALTAEGERLLRALLEELLGKLRAWEAWAKTP